MTREKIVKRIKNRFGKRVKDFHDKSSKRIYINIDKKDIFEFASFIFKELGARFNTASAVDHPEEIEMMYHFNLDGIGLIVTLRAYVSKEECDIDSLLPLMKGAEWIEREIHELFGVEFNNHPDMKRLLLPDDWPEGKFPLRKDYKLMPKEESNVLACKRRQTNES